jgi:DNA-binding NarL/FixJ family response regulator
MLHRPDVAIVDLVMPGLNGETTQRMLLVFRRTRARPRDLRPHVLI